ncbi:MAG: cell wall hydrolase [Herbinix sp.]|nr:cell wall hydrolase [Herbinix sp.]
MNTFKRFFITLSAVLVISLGFSQAANASELENTENQVVANDIENKVATDIENNENQSNIPDEDNTTENSETSETEDVEDIEDIEGEFDSDAYEIFIDEQGQVYYIEKEPAEPEILDSDEIVVEEKKTKKPTYTKGELRLLSCLVYTEAGNQSYKGMLAVANVVLNRVKSDVYNHVNTIKEVIYDKQWAVQFSVTIKSKKTGKSMLDKALEAYDNGKFTGSNPAAEKKAMDKAIKAAKAALNGENNIGDYLCFRMNNDGAKRIRVKYTDNRVLGDHIFYRTK